MQTDLIAITMHGTRATVLAAPWHVPHWHKVSAIARQPAITQETPSLPELDSYGSHRLCSRGEQLHRHWLALIETSRRWAANSDSETVEVREGSGHRANALVSSRPKKAPVAQVGSSGWLPRRQQPGVVTESATTPWACRLMEALCQSGWHRGCMDRCTIDPGSRPFAMICEGTGAFF